MQYWLKVSQYTDAVGTWKFKSLADYALACQPAPVPDATINHHIFFHGLFPKTKPEIQ